MRVRYVILLCFVLLFLPSLAFSSVSEREKVIQETLSKLKQKQPSKITLQDKDLSSIFFSQRQTIIKEALDKIEIELSLKIGHIFGHTDYEINFFSGGSEAASRLEFPFDNTIAGASLSLGYDKLSLNLEALRHINKTSGKDMFDKDWLSGVLYSFTESDALVDIKIFDVNLTYDFGTIYNNPWFLADTADLSFLIGYKYQDFDFAINNARYHIPQGTSALDGMVLDYEVQYRIPYLGFEILLLKDIKSSRGYPYDPSKWGMGLKLCFAPYITSKDKDDHVLRGKLSTADARGYGWLSGLNFLFKPKDNWSFGLGVDYTWIDTDGYQAQFWYKDEGSTPAGTLITGIDDEITASEILWWSQIAYRF